MPRANNSRLLFNLACIHGETDDRQLQDSALSYYITAFINWSMGQTYYKDGQTVLMQVTCSLLPMRICQLAYCKNKCQVNFGRIDPHHLVNNRSRRTG